jgi:hypothetical protein
MLKEMLLSYVESDTGEKCMTKTAEKQIAKTIRVKREQLSAIRAEVEDLFDYLAVLEARARDNGKPRLTHGEVKKRYGLK